jgi:AcrR family transcriptional regulator
VPTPWQETLAAHRRDVRAAILDATAALVAEHGLRGTTMARVAAASGITRATLYKYFPGVEAILLAWHERHVAGHLARLAELRDVPGGAGVRLAAVLEEYALITHERPHGTELAALAHRGEHLAHAERHLESMVRGLLAAAAAAGEARDDVPADELAAYCLHALAAAGALPSREAVGRLVAVTLAGLRPR